MSVVLWNVIRDFFVKYIFGGNTSDGSNYAGLLGGNSNYGTYGTDWGLIKTGLVDESDTVLYTSFGDWLSTTLTIITLLLICYVFLKITVWFFKWGAGLFKW